MKLGYGGLPPEKLFLNHNVYNAGKHPHHKIGEIERVQLRGIIPAPPAAMEEGRGGSRPSSVPENDAKLKCNYSFALNCRGWIFF